MVLSAKSPGAAAGLLVFLALAPLTAEARLSAPDAPASPRPAVGTGGAGPASEMRQVSLRCIPFCTQVGSQGRQRVQDHRAPHHPGRAPRPRPPRR